MAFQSRSKHPDMCEICQLRFDVWPMRCGINVETGLEAPILTRSLAIAPRSKSGEKGLNIRTRVRIRVRASVQRQRGTAPLHMDFGEKHPDPMHLTVAKSGVLSWWKW